tara:strand:+ start:751 stop:909 length:159 start_codon:yes stop_codon:yes gene_type:complete
MKKSETFITLLFIFCMGMFTYNYFTDDIKSMMFWGVLTLINGQSLTDLKSKN